MELLFIRNEREHAAMLRLQEEMLENAKRQTSSNADRIRTLNKTHDFLRKRFIEVNSFIKDCVDKKRIAEKKVAEETAMHEVVKENIKKYKSSIQELCEALILLKTK